MKHAVRDYPSGVLTRISLVGVLALVAVLLTGCASVIGGVIRSYPGLPESLTDQQRAEVPRDEPSAWWMDEGSTAALVTWGSSSCPLEVTRIEAVSGGEVVLRIDRSGGDVCTDDMAAYTNELTIPRNSDRPLTLTLIYSDLGTAETVTLP